MGIRRANNLAKDFYNSSSGRTRASRGCDYTAGLPYSPIPCPDIGVTRLSQRTGLSQSTPSRFLAAILLYPSRKSDGAESVLGDTGSSAVCACLSLFEASSPDLSCRIVNISDSSSKCFPRYRIGSAFYLFIPRIGSIAGRKA
jgi:hypothetical protein